MAVKFILAATDEAAQKRFRREAKLAAKTSAEWVERRLGKPTTSEPMFTDAKKLWRYEYEKIEQPDGTAYRILDDTFTSRRIARAIHFEISAGVVERWWIE